MAETIIELEGRTLRLDVEISVTGDPERLRTDVPRRLTEGRPNDPRYAHGPRMSPATTTEETGVVRSAHGSFPSFRAFEALGRLESS